jgi:hypothetical protein
MRGDRNAIIGIARLANDCRRPVGADGIHCARIQHKERGRNRPSSASWRADLMEITAAPHVIGADFQDEKAGPRTVKGARHREPAGHVMRLWHGHCS